MAAATIVVMCGCAGEHIGAAEDETLDTYREADLDFLSTLYPGPGASPGEYYDDVDDAARSASVVLIGRISAITETDPVLGETPDDTLHGIGIVIEPIEVLVGELPSRFHDELRLFTPVGEQNPLAGIDGARPELPHSQAVWFLRSGEQLASATKEYLMSQDGEIDDEFAEQLEKDKEYYTLINYSQGLFAQGEHTVVNPAGDPTSEQDGGDMVANATSYEKLSELVEDLRQVDGWHGQSDEIENLLNES